MKQVQNKRYVFLIYAALAVATIVAYEPIRHNEFISFDDTIYVTENRSVNEGITPRSFVWAFTPEGKGGNWHPVTWLSHMLDCELFDLNPFWHHLTSLLFHIVNTLLLFYVFKRMTGAVWQSAFVAAAFALHPLHVESVAWVAERKDVLSGFFWMLTIAAYIRYAEQPCIRQYLLVALALCLGLMAKPMVVTLPFVLLLLDYWPLGRFQWGSQSGEGALGQSELVEVSHQQVAVYRLIVEKIPLLVLIVVSCAVTYIVEQSWGTMKAQESVSLISRIANGVVSYISYIIKTIYPSGLAALYPHPGDSLPTWKLIVSVVILAGISAVAIYIGRRRRYLPVGWLWYLGTLVPVIGLIQIGSQAMADRYTYLPSIGIFIIFAFGVAELVKQNRYRKITLGLTAGTVLAALLICTRIQVACWRDSLTLFEHALVVTKNNWMMQNNYAIALHEKGRVDEALEHFKEALRINPKFLEGYNNIGRALLTQGRFDEAIECFKEVLRSKPDHPYANFNLAMIMAQQGKYDDAIKHFSEAVRAKPDWAEAYYYLGLAYAQQGKYEPAIENFREALQINPNYAEARENLDIALSEQDKTKIVK